MKKLLLILAVIIAGAFILIKTININKYKPLAETAIYNASGYKTKIKGKISISLIPFGLKISDISLKNPSGFYKKDIARIGAIYIGINPLSLIHITNIKAESIMIKNLKAYIIKNKDGVLNINRQKESNQDEKQPSKGFAIKKLTIQNASLMYKNLSDKQYILIKNINLAAYLRYRPKKKMYEGIKASGNVQIGKITINRITPITNLRANFSMDEGILNINRLTYKLFNSNAFGNINVDFSQKGMCKIRQTCKNLNLTSLSLSIYKNVKLKGFAHIKINLNFNTAHAIKTLHGIFTADGKNITLKGENLDNIIAGYEKTNNVNVVDIGSFFIVGPLGALANKAYSVGYAAKGFMGTTNIKQVKVNIKINHGKGYLQDVAFSTDKNRIAAKGILDFSNNRYENVRVAVLDKKGCAKIIQRIEGSFSQPKVEIAQTVIGTMVNKITTFFKKLEKSVGIKEKKCKPFYMGIIKQP